jgi:hypothetical protein
MVVTDLPATARTGSTQLCLGTPSTCTVQEPHTAMPQANFVPVSPSVSRSTHNSGVSSGTSTFRVTPLTTISTTHRSSQAWRVGSAPERRPGC